jgi:hypothetical protein
VKYCGQGVGSVLKRGGCIDVVSGEKIQNGVNVKDDMMPSLLLSIVVRLA